jgi:hypothetical protein
MLLNLTYLRADFKIDLLQFIFITRNAVGNRKYNQTELSHYRKIIILLIKSLDQSINV